MKSNSLKIKWLRQLKHAVFVGIALGATSGCSILPTVPPAVEAIAQTHKAPELDNVPFYPQEEYQCGPAALATVLDYEGDSLTPEDLVKEVYLPDRKGSLQLEMLATTRRKGYLAYRMEPQPTALLNALSNNKPVVVLMNLSLPIYPVWHYAVLVGYDAKTDEVILRSALKKRETIKLATFLKLWQRGDNWAFVVLKPNETPPPFANPDNYLGSALALERVDAVKANQAYTQAIDTWPDNPYFPFGLGNTLYQSKDFKKAEKAYRKAVELDPAFADAWNNLAEVLWEQNKKPQAQNAIQKAVFIGGPRLDMYLETAKKMDAS